MPGFELEPGAEAEPLYLVDVHATGAYTSLRSAVRYRVGPLSQSRCHAGFPA